MPATTTANPVVRVACPGCALPLAVKAELAGQPVKCRCGHAFVAPTVEEVLAIAQQRAAELALARGYTPAHKRPVLEDEHPVPQYDPLLDHIIPIALLPLGVLLALVQAMYFDKHEHRFIEVIGPTVVVVIASTVLMVAAVVLAALGLGMTFHTRPAQTALKIAAIALVPGPVGGIVTAAMGGMGGEICGPLIAIALYTVLVKSILRQSWEHTAVIVFACWTIRTFTLYAIYKCQGAANGAWF